MARLASIRTSAGIASRSASRSFLNAAFKSLVTSNLPSGQTEPLLHDRNAPAIAQNGLRLEPCGRRFLQYFATRSRIATLYGAFPEGADLQHPVQMPNRFTLAPGFLASETICVRDSCVCQQVRVGAAAYDRPFHVKGEPQPPTRKRRRKRRGASSGRMCWHDQNGHGETLGRKATASILSPLLTSDK